MFTDPMTYERQAKYSLNICHDCTVAILEMFPDDIKQRFVGGHPAYKDKTPREERCCQYAWCFSDDEDDAIALTGE